MPWSRFSAKRHARRNARPSSRRPCRSRGRSCVPHDTHLGDEIDAEAPPYGVAGVLDQRLDVRGARLSLRVDDEISVLLGDASAADFMALEPAGLDEARSVVAGRVAEYRARIRKLERLLLDALRQQLFDACPGALLVAGAKTKPGGEKPFVFAQPRSAQLDAAITRREIARTALAQFPGARHRQHLRDDVPGFRPVTAGVHRQRSADRARYSSEKLRAFETARRREPRKLGTGDAGLGVDQLSLGTHRAPRAVHQDHRAALAAITHQKIAAQSHEVQQIVLGKRCKKCGEIGAVRRDIGPCRDPAGAPADVLRHRFVQAQYAAQDSGGSADRLGHLHLPALASAAGTPPIEPAPIVRTTSPERTSLRMASGMSEIFSTNTGSVLPATRIASASDRPSAATIGVSPAR